MNPTLGNAVDTYFKRRAKPGRYWEELEGRFQRHIVPGLGGRERILVTVTKADLRKLIDAKEDEGHPVAARTLYEGLSPFFRWCQGRDLLLSNPLATLPPPPVPKDRERVLDDDEMKAIWEATFKMPLWGPFVRLLMLTIQRREEVSGIQYSEIKDDTWTIPGSRTKNGKTHIVHLSETAKSIIDSKPLFIGRGVSGYSRAKTKLDKLSGVTDWRLHDLRRTGATKLQELGVDDRVIDRIQNHSVKGVKRVYQRYQFLPQRKEALDLLGLWLATL